MARSRYRMTAARRNALRKAQIASAKKRRRNKKIVKAVGIGVLGSGALVGVAVGGHKVGQAQKIKKATRAHNAAVAAHNSAVKAAHSAFLHNAMNPNKAILKTYPYINKTNSINWKISQSPTESAAIKGRSVPGGAASSRQVTKKWIAKWQEASGVTVGGRKVVRTKVKRKSLAGKFMAELDGSKYEVIFENG